MLLSDGVPDPCLQVLGTVLGAAVRAASAVGFSGIGAIPKFESVESIHIIVAGAAAGKFSMFCPGFGVGRAPMPSANLSRPVTRTVQCPTQPVTTTGPGPSASEHVVLDPTSEQDVPIFNPTKRTGQIGGTVGLLDISKPGGSIVLARLAEKLTQMYPTLTVNRYTKPTFSRRAPPELIKQITGSCNFVIAALAD